MGAWSLQSRKEFPTELKKVTHLFEVLEGELVHWIDLRETGDDKVQDWASGGHGSVALSCSVYHQLGGLCLLQAMLYGLWCHLRKSGKRDEKTPQKTIEGNMRTEVTLIMTEYFEIIIPLYRTRLNIYLPLPDLIPLTLEESEPAPRCQVCSLQRWKEASGCGPQCLLVGCDLRWCAQSAHSSAPQDVDSPDAPHHWWEEKGCKRLGRKKECGRKNMCQIPISQ